MNVFIAILLIIVGIALLVIGANLFVDGASGIAEKLKISAFIIGMTIVAFGTSAPELAVSLKSVIAGSGDIAMGNVVGSNIMNILLILGVSAVIRPLNVEKKTAILEIPFLILITGAFIVMTELGGEQLTSGGIITRWEGGILIGLLVVYVVYMVVSGVRERKKATSQLPSEGMRSVEGEVQTAESEVKTEKKGLFGLYARLKTKVWFLIIITLVGLAGVVFGANFVVDNVDALTALMPEGNWKKIISVTVVALGTSLPELVTSIVASVKGNSDLALGNVIGSNILNILLIIGLPALIMPIVFTSTYLVDLIVSLGAATLLLLCVLIGRSQKINRAGGIVMLCCLCGYLVYLFLS